MKRLAGLAPEIIALIALLFTVQQNWTEGNRQRIIRADGLGYYAYLPAVFIYQDPQFAFIDTIEKKYRQPADKNGYIVETGDGKANKYFAGTAVLWLPFFLAAHLLAGWSGVATDGYAAIYGCFVSLAAVFYLWAGTVFLQKLLLKYRLGKNISAFILAGVVFGTNLFFYSYFDAAWSHVYSFAAVSAFVYFTYLTLCEDKKYFYLLAVIYGLVVLIRPTNALVILIVPFFAGSLTSLKQFLTQKKIRILKSLPLLFLVLAIQSLCWYWQTGHLLLWPYGEERFHFGDPEFLAVLFGYEKGLFVYTPLILVSLFGLIHVYRTNRFRFGVMGIFLFFITYVIASWWCWWYGGGLSQRAFIDYYAVAGLLLGFLWQMVKGNLWWKGCYLFILACSISYSFLLGYQYREGILKWDVMSREGFWKVFLQTAPEYKGILWEKKSWLTENTVRLKARYTNGFEEAAAEPWAYPASLLLKTTCTGKRALAVYPDTLLLFRTSYTRVYPSMPAFLRIEMKALFQEKPFRQRLLIVSEHNGTAYKEESCFFLQDFTTPGEWFSFDFEYRLERRPFHDEVKVYLVGEGAPFVIDDADIRFYEWKGEGPDYYLGKKLQAFSLHAEGKIICAELGGAADLAANREQLGPWEIFSVLNISGDTVAIRASNNKFIFPDTTHASALRALADSVTTQSLFIMESADENNIRLKGLNGKYVRSGDGGRLFCDGNAFRSVKITLEKLGME